MHLNSRYDWQLATQPELNTAQALAATLSVPLFLAQLLLQRGVTTKEAYQALIEPDITKLHDPLLLHDMDKAVHRIEQAVANQEKITIYGDYDVDGLTASSIMKETLESIGAEPEVFIPDRFTDGYGPNAAVYRYLQSSGTQLLITVDNGIAGADVIDPAQASGMDVIVTDHHELGDQLPQAVAVVHPRYPGSDYPFGQLSGAGVAFKLASALLGGPPMESIDLAALGTVADIVSLTDENRLIVQLGLQMIRTQPRVGLEALLKVAGIEPATVDETSVGFGIGPRLNALGRLGDANPGVTLLTTFDDQEAQALAENVNKLNEERQALVKKIAKEALAIANQPENQSKRTLVIAHQGWHEGVLGIVASRVVEETGKPTLILNVSKSGESAKGSGRSVEAYHLFNAMNAGKELMTHFGGHHMAVGLTMPVANLEALWALMEEAAAKVLADQPQPPLAVALPLQAADLTLANYDLVRQLAPFGPDNPEPVFTLKPERINQVKVMGKTGDHLRFSADGVTVVAFNQGTQAQALADAQQAKLAVTMATNTWQNRTTFQLMLKDWQLHQPEIIDLRLPQVSGEQFRGAYTYLFFSAKHQQQYASRFFFGGPTMLVSEITAPLANAVLVDLPPDEASLKAAMQKVTLPVRVAFSSPAQELVALPTRKEFGAVLIALRNHPHLDKHQLGRLATQLHMAVSQVVLAVQVFLELGFVRIEAAAIDVVPDVARQELSAAPAYQARAAFLTLAHFLQTASRVDLAERLIQMKSEANHDH